MLLPSQPLPSVPDDTARIARAAFRRGNPYVLLRDKESVKKLGRYAASWIAWWPNRPSSTAALT